MSSLPYRPPHWQIRLGAFLVRRAADSLLKLGILVGSHRLGMFALQMMLHARRRELGIAPLPTIASVFESAASSNAGGPQS